MCDRDGKMLQESILKMVELHGMGISIEDLACALGVEISMMRMHLTELETKDKIFISDHQVRLKCRRFKVFM